MDSNLKAAIDNRDVADLAEKLFDVATAQPDQVTAVTALVTASVAVLAGHFGGLGAIALIHSMLDRLEPAIEAAALAGMEVDGSC